MKNVMNKSLILLALAIQSIPAFADKSESLIWINIDLANPPHYFAARFLHKQTECGAKTGKIRRAFNDEFEWAKRLENEKLTVRIGNHDLKPVINNKGIGIKLFINSGDQRSLYIERALDFISQLNEPLFRSELAAYCARMRFPDNQHDFNTGADLYYSLKQRDQEEWEGLFMEFLRDDMFWKGFKEKEIDLAMEEFQMEISRD